MAVPLLILAPLRGVTQLEFRKCLARHFPGFGLAYSPFIPTAAGARFKLQMLRDVLPDGNEGSIPLVPQTIGKNPDDFRTFLRALKDLGYSRCDLNAGCPWPMILKRGRGAGLLKSPDVLFSMLDAGCDEMPGGISLKTRLGVAATSELEPMIDRLNGYPLAALAIHCRTAAQMYSGAPDLEAFARCLAIAKMPVFYNGDVGTPADVAEVAARFPSIAGIMIGRGAIRDPSIATRALGLPCGDLRRALAAFVADYSAMNRERLFGPASFLGRMKEFWSYFKDSFADGEGLWREIRVSRTYDEYDRAVARISR